jgi:hypothetical protein
MPRVDEKRRRPSPPPAYKFNAVIADRLISADDMTENIAAWPG